MKIAIPKEIHVGEKRVALTPAVAEKIIQLGFELSIETQAGAGADIPDQAYQAVGVTIVNSAAELWANAELIMKVRPPLASEVDLISENSHLISFIWPAQNPELLQQFVAKKLTVLAMDCVPRISRAQKCDALSSMANIAGYRAVIEAAQHFGRFFTGQITAAGKIPPAKVLVIGAGVAGLAAIGAAKSLGAIVRAFDTRPEVKEQIESMDAEFLMLDFKEEGSGVGGYAKVMSKEFIEAEMALFAAQAKEVDIIITTALIPGRPAPKLITTDMVANMKTGSVIVDLAAEQGGNCELTEKDQVVIRHGVTIIGYSNLPSRLANQSSQLYATNLRHLLSELCPQKNGQIELNMNDEMIRGATVVQAGNITYPPPPPTLTVATQTPTTATVSQTPTSTAAPSVWRQFLPIGLAITTLLAVGAVAPAAFISHFTVFVLACFVGYQVIWNVSPSLHTPLMSVTNAISGIIVVGALIQVSTTNLTLQILAGLAILIASINIAGGFLVTRRMLAMFRK
ncbi:MAG: hypothetical protein RL637_1638 [Pseudomonadota bacterium]